MEFRTLTRTVAVAAALGAALMVLATEPTSAQNINPADLAEARAMMEVGEHTLTARPGKTRRPIPEAGKKKPKRNATERVYTKDEVVYLFPYTRALEKVVLESRGNPVLIAASLGAAGEVAGRVFTDKNGYFTFRGLKPGRYMVMTAVPYKVATVTAEDTGKTRTTTTFGYNGWFINSANSVTEPVYRYRDTISDFEHRIVKVVEVKAGQTVTNLGEME
jgi:hypothetical protein